MGRSNKHGLMPPPWLAYPQLERESLGWRMGAGADYIDRFGEWWVTMDADKKARYQTLFPEPVAWKGWWRNEDNCERFGYGEYLTELWRPLGEPKYSKAWLCQNSAEDKAQEIYMFWTPLPEESETEDISKACFSPLWMQEFVSGISTYSCVEQFVTAQMAELFGDKTVREEIMKCDDPRWIKALGRRCEGFNAEIWDMVKYTVMLNGNWYKFSQNKRLRDFLLSTGDRVLVYASPYDNVWGSMFAEGDDKANFPENWEGRNLLGFALMEVRDELRRVWQNEMLCDFDEVEP